MSIFVDLSDAPEQARGAVDFWAGLIDAAAAEGGEGEPGFRQAGQELIGQGAFGDLAGRLGARTGVLWRYSSAKEIESCYVLLCALVRSADAAARADLAMRLAQSVAEQTEAEAALRSRILATLYNFFPEERLALLLAFVRHCEATGDASVLEAQWPQLPRWADAWKLAPADRVALFAACHSLFRSQELPELAFAASRAAVEAHADPASDAARADAARCVEEALTLPDQYVLEDLAALAPVRALADHADSRELHALLQVVVSGSVADFEALPAGLWAARPALEREALLAKVRLLALCSAAEHEAALPFAAAAAALGLPEARGAALESWIIRAMSQGLLTGKLDQEAQVVRISSVVSRTFGPRQWSKVETELQGWLAAVRNVRQLVADGKPVPAK